MLDRAALAELRVIPIDGYNGEALTANVFMFGLGRCCRNLAEVRPIGVVKDPAHRGRCPSARSPYTFAFSRT